MGQADYVVKDYGTFMKDNKISLLQSVFNRALAGDGQESIAWEKVLFALDKDLDYSEPRRMGTGR